MDEENQKKPDSIKFHPEGRKEARVATGEEGMGREGTNLLRRRRLAECLFLKVFHLKRYEALSLLLGKALTEEDADEICTFLGHPRFCPHEKTIPLGQCCVEKRKARAPVAVPLLHLKSGASGRVLTIVTDSARRRSILTSYGLTPGSLVTLVQKRPTVIVKVEETEIALDREVAEDIWVKPL